MNETFSPEQEEWIAGQPPAVAARVRAFPPTQAYRMTDTGQKVWIQAYSEDDTCRVLALHSENPETMNAFMFPEESGVSIFGIAYDVLEPIP